MPPTPPSHDDVLDFDGLDMKPSQSSKSTAAESDFEKELEALFAEELASSDETPASAPPVGAPELEEDALLLDDLVEDAPAAPSLASVDDPAADEDDILDLSAFDAGGGLDITPPDDSAGGTGGEIDLSGLDELITGLGDSKASAPAAAEPSPAVEPELPSLDGTDMASLLEDLDVPAHQPAAPPVDLEPEDGLLELSLTDLVDLEPEPAPAPVSEPAQESASPEPLDLELPAADDTILDLTLPDLSDPEPGRDLLDEQEQMDIGGDLNLSLDDILEAPTATAMDQVLGDELSMDGLLEGIETSEGEPAPEVSLDPKALLDQIPDHEEPALSAQLPDMAELPVEPAPAAVAEPLAMPEPEPVLEPAETLSFDVEPVPVEPAHAEPAAPLADAALGALAVGTAAAALAGLAAGSQSEPPAAEPVAPQSAPSVPLAATQPEATPSAAAPAGISGPALAEMQERLTQLATQVTGNSVAVVRLEGKLAEREKNLAELDERLKASQAEAQTLREELAALRAHLESSLEAQNEEVRQELAQSSQSAADKSQAAMEKALSAVDKALAAMDKAQGAADRADSLAPRVESAEMTVRGAGARLAQLENRQSQLDREVFAEISRAVPREAAKVIREEIAHLAESMRDE